MPFKIRKKQLQAKPAAPAVYSYDPRKDGVTKSLIETYLACPRKFWNYYASGLSGPAEFSGSLTRGTLFHEVLEHAYSNSNFTPKEMSANKPQFIEQIKHYIRIKESMAKATAIKNAAPADKLEELEELFAVAEVLIPEYFQAWIKDYSINEWIDLEKEFDVPFKLKDGRTISLKGKIDGVFKGYKDRICIFESKTKSIINEDYITSTLNFDLQVMWYMYAASTIYETTYTPHLIYNVARWPLLKRSTKETLPKYQERVQADIQARPDHYFKRFDYAPTDEEFSSFIKGDLRQILTRFMDDWDTHRSYFRNVSSCNDYNRLCPFIKLCSDSNRVGLINREKPFSELDLV